MILSSADILRVLGGDPVIRQEARLSIVDDKPGIGLDEYVYIYVQRYPTVDEFEATWKIWVQDGGSDVLDLVLAAMTRMLPNFDYHKTHYSTTDFKSDRTEVEPEEELEFTEQDELNARFRLLSDEVLKKVNGLRDGLDGIDGLTGPQGPAGRDGVDGRDGKDIDATDTDLEDLRNVEQGIPYEKGQVLTWDGTKWTNLYVQQVFKSGGGGSVTDTGSGGPLSSSLWKYRDNQASPPGDKKITFNNADYTLVTEVYIDKTTLDGDAVGNYLLALITEGTDLYLQRQKDDTKGVLFNVVSDAVDSGDYVTATVTFSTSSGNELDNDKETILTVIGGGGGVTALNDLTDVDAPSPNHGDIISYNSVSGNWESNAAPPVDISGNSIDELSDVDTSTTAPTAGQVLKWDGANWVPSDDNNTDAVDSVNGQTGTVVLGAADVGAATAAKGALADTAIQPGDNISDLVNDAGYITDAGVTQIVAGTNITIDPVGGTGVVTINAAADANDADGGDFGPLPDPDGGDFETGTTISTLAYPVDGGDFEAGTTEAFGDSSFDGGEVT